MPQGTGGAKYEMMLQNTPQIHRVEINNDIGERLIENALKYPTEEGWDIVKIIFPDIGEYEPPLAEVPTSEETTSDM